MENNNVGMKQVGFRGSFMRGFQDLCCKTSLHGWVFLGEVNCSVSQTKINIPYHQHTKRLICSMSVVKN